MKVLYCYRYGILGGVCAQLINRMEVLQASGALEGHLLFAQDYGISQTLANHPHLYFEPDGPKAAELARGGAFDAACVIDTPEYLEALTKVPDLPLIVEVHTTTESGLAYLASRPWRVAGYIVPSIYSREMLRQRFGIGEQERVEVVPNSLDARLFPASVVNAPGARPIFGWVGKLDDHKNWRDFLEFAANLTNRGVDAAYWLVGGETAPPARQAELLDLSEQLNLHTHLRWFPRIEYRAMHRFCAAVRAGGGMMIVTSINESFGMSVLEALMCGCPVLASRVGALPEIAPDRPYLRFYEPRNVEQAAELAARLLEPPEAGGMRRALERDRSWLVGTYSSATVAHRYRAILRALVAS